MAGSSFSDRTYCSGTDFPPDDTENRRNPGDRAVVILIVVALVMAHTLVASSLFTRVLGLIASLWELGTDAREMILGAVGVALHYVISFFSPHAGGEFSAGMRNSVGVLLCGER
jgi:hypothetical protein